MSCKTCKHYHSKYFRCQRYPVFADKRPDDSCGESVAGVTHSEA